MKYAQSRYLYDDLFFIAREVIVPRTWDMVCDTVLVMIHVDAGPARHLLKEEIAWVVLLGNY